MGFVPFDNVLKLEAIYDLDGQICENVFHYWSADGPTVASATALAAQFRTTWVANLQPLVNPTLQLWRIAVTSLETQNAFGIEYTSGLPALGTDSSASVVSNNNAIVVRWNTQFRGRSYRGRTYHMGFNENKVTINTVTSAYGTALAAAYYQFIVLADGTYTWALGVASRIHDGAERAQGVFTLVSGVTVNNVVDSQRRRLPGRGR